MQNTLFWIYVWHFKWESAFSCWEHQGTTRLREWRGPSPKCPSTDLTEKTDRCLERAQTDSLFPLKYKSHLLRGRRINFERSFLILRICATLCFPNRSCLWGKKGGQYGPNSFPDLWLPPARLKVEPFTKHKCTRGELNHDCVPSPVMMTTDAKTRRRGDLAPNQANGRLLPPQSKLKWEKTCVTKPILQRRSAHSPFFLQQERRQGRKWVTELFPWPAGTLSCIQRDT